MYIIGTKSQLKSAIRRDSRPRNTEMKEMLMEEIIPKLKQMQQGQDCTMDSQRQTRSQTVNATQSRGMCGSQVPYSTQAKGMFGSQAASSTHVRGVLGSQASSTAQVRGMYGNQIASSTHNSRNTFSQTHTSKEGGQRCTWSSLARSSHASAADPEIQEYPRARTFKPFQPLMTSTQIGPSSSQYSNHTKTSNFTQWRQKPPCSPVKSFTSVRDLPKTSPNAAAGVSHSTPKLSRTSAHDFQQDRNDDHNEWSDEWSEERLQQVIDMETTAMANSPGKATPPLFEDETGGKGLTKKSFRVCQPKPLFQSTCENCNTHAKCFRKFKPGSAGPEDSGSNKVFVQPKCNTDTQDVSPQGHGFKSPPPNCKHKPKVAVSPFTPNTSGKLTEAWSLKSTPRNVVAKRLYTDMKESPITDGFPSKKRNDANDSDLMY